MVGKVGESQSKPMTSINKDTALVHQQISLSGLDLDESYMRLKVRFYGDHFYDSYCS
jgi:hypothetical protein